MTTEPAPKGMPFRTNPPGTDEWKMQLGALFLNFGALEFLVLMAIRTFSEDDLMLELSCDMPFSKRLDLLIRLLQHRKVSTELVEKTRAMVKEMRVLSELRNAAAHNPLVFGWHGPETSTPDFIGISNVKKVFRLDRPPTPLVRLDELKAHVDRAMQLAPELHSLTQSIADYLNSVDEANPTE